MSSFMKLARCFRCLMYRMGRQLQRKERYQRLRRKPPGPVSTGRIQQLADKRWNAETMLIMRLCLKLDAVPRQLDCNARKRDMRMR